MPPKIQTKKTIPGVPTRSIMARGTRKIPLPMTVPTTIDPAAQRPSSRLSSSDVSMIQPRGGFDPFSDDHAARSGLRLLEPGENPAHEKGGTGADEHVPRPRD